ncbi:helix-turn-helix domain-containing protein [Streptomyces sp. NPDC046805]|uniref:winged helix-turn-helix transcriptional regulator n=1 Tax=Streptomyces sp. NPDC046805 TaxID=3155134 RepID=UPI0033C16AC1
MSTRAEGSDYLIALRDGALRDAPVESVPTNTLLVAYTPRSDGEDEEFVRQLAESVTPWPAIVVHRPTMTVVDGIHRMRAAQLRGEERIAVRFFDGDVQDAALLAVAVNVTHGRALSVADRVAAAERIFLARPDWSDRAVAAVAGLSAKKVAQVRRTCGADTPDVGHRVGRDGRARPVSSAQGRELASRLIRQNPGASLRQIARRVGISPATVADVRDRMLRGEDPLPPRQRAAESRTDQCAVGSDGVAVVRVAEPPAAAHAEPPAGVTSLMRAQPGRQILRPRPRGSRSPVELLTIFDSLRRDPSLRLNDAGRNVLRMLDACSSVVRDRQRILDTVPAHCRRPLSQLADGYAEIWQLLAEELRHAELSDTEMARPSSLGA